METLDYDVVCIGAGGAGVTAATTAAAVGARVLLLAKEPLGYGNTRIAMGVVASVGLHPEDSSGVFYDDLITGGAHLNNPNLAWAMAEEARLCPGIAEDLGNVFRRDEQGEISRDAASRVGGHRLARSLTVYGKGVAMGQTLRAASARATLDAREETITVRLLREGGRIAGLVAWDIAAGEPLVVRAKAVILATGGLGWLYYPHTDCVRASTGNGYIKRGASVRAAIAMVEISRRLPPPVDLLEAALIALPTRIEIKEDAEREAEEIIRDIVKETEKKA